MPIHTKPNLDGILNKMKHTKEEFLLDMAELEASWRFFDKLVDRYSDIINFDPVFEFKGKYEDLMLKLLDQKYSISASDIYWFIYENNFGKKEMEASSGTGDPLHPVKNASDFWGLHYD